MEISEEEMAKEERRKIITGVLVREGPVLAESLPVAKIKARFGVVQQTKQVHLQSAFWLMLISVCKISSILLPFLITNILI